MATRKNLLLLFLILILLLIGFDLAPLLQKENIEEISFSDFRSSIGPLLSGIAVLLSYKAEIKKERNTKNQNTSSF